MDTFLIFPNFLGSKVFFTDVGKPPTCWKPDSCFWLARKDKQEIKANFTLRSRTNAHLPSNTPAPTPVTRLLFKKKIRSSPSSSSPLLLGLPCSLIFGFSSLAPKKIEQGKTYFSIRDSIKSNETGFLKCFRCQCYF